MKQNHTTLGRGLMSLVSEENKNPAFIPNLNIEKIVPNPYQPRLNLNEIKLQELTESILESGIIEPLIVKRIDMDRYELIAGERRWRASQKAGLKTVPVVVKDVSPQQMLELAIVENVQRADLNPLEEALAFDQLVEKFQLTPSDIAKKVGFSPSLVSNKLRLLQLPDNIKQGLIDEVITEGHAKTLLGIKHEDTMLLAYRKVVTQKLSVRATEELVRRLNLGVKETTKKNQILIDSTTTSYEQKLKSYFSSEKIKLARSKRGGKIEFRFKNDEELEQILKKIGLL
jgi:ParB family chromosome partitioning protein